MRAVNEDESQSLDIGLRVIVYDLSLFASVIWNEGWPLMENDFRSMEKAEDGGGVRWLIAGGNQEEKHGDGGWLGEGRGEERGEREHIFVLCVYLLPARKFIIHLLTVNMMQ